ncbi:MAG TPA: hypothetical protein VE933_04145 [Chitinophagaceae bacterium]|nr:hypothetical protein [Chitinophagaceae bacterium]
MKRTIAQSSPDVNILTDIYTVPLNTLTTLGTIVVCNRSGLASSFRISIAPLGEGDNVKQYLFYDMEIAAYATLSFAISMPIGAGDVVRVYSGNGQISFNLFGSEL